MSDAPQIEMISVHKIDFHDANIRDNHRNTDELATSIGAMGVLHPLTVIPNGGGFLVADGARRLAASRTAGLEEVPCIVHLDLDDTADITEHMAVANLAREGLNPLEEAKAFKTLVDNGRSQRYIADLIGISQSHVSKRLDLLLLSPAMQTELLERAMTLEEAATLAQLKEHPDQINNAYERARQNGYSIRKTVEDVLKSFDRDRKKVEATERLKKAGIQTYREEDLHEGDLSPKEWADLNDLGLVAGSHALDKCHAAYVDAAGDIVHICTDPAAHEEGGSSSLRRKPPEEDDLGFDATGMSEPEKKERSERRDESFQQHKALAKAYEKRTAHIRDEILSHRVAKMEILDLLVQASILHSMETSNVTAAGDFAIMLCARLGLEVKDGDDAYEVLEEYLLDHPERLATVGLGIAIERFESSIYGGLFTARHVDYFRFLGGHGYDMTGAEDKALKDAKNGGPAPAPKELDRTDDETLLSSDEVAEQFAGEVVADVSGSVARPVGAAAK